MIRRGVSKIRRMSARRKRGSRRMNRNGLSSLCKRGLEGAGCGRYGWMPVDGSAVERYFSMPAPARKSKVQAQDMNQSCAMSSLDTYLLSMLTTGWTTALLSRSTTDQRGELLSANGDPSANTTLRSNFELADVLRCKRRDGTSSQRVNLNVWMSIWMEWGTTGTPLPSLGAVQGTVAPKKIEDFFTFTFDPPTTKLPRLLAPICN